MMSLEGLDALDLDFSRKSPREILNFCMTNKSTYSLCTDNFWEGLLLSRYGNVRGNLKPNLEYQQRYKEDAKLFFSSVANNDLNTVNQILERGFDVNLQDRYGRTPLIIASKNGYLEIVKALINEGADLNIADQSGATALAAAEANNHNKVVQELLLEGAL